MGHGIVGHQQVMLLLWRYLDPERHPAQIRLGVRLSAPGGVREADDRRVGRVRLGKLHPQLGWMSRNRSSASSTASVDLAWKARSTGRGTPCALALLWFFSWTRMISLASWSNTRRSASGLPPW